MSWKRGGSGALNLLPTLSGKTELTRAVLPVRSKKENLSSRLKGERKALLVKELARERGDGRVAALCRRMADVPKGL